MFQQEDKKNTKDQPVSQKDTSARGQRIHESVREKADQGSEQNGEPDDEVVPALHPLGSDDAYGGTYLGTHGHTQGRTDYGRRNKGQQGRQLGNESGY